MHFYHFALHYIANTFNEIYCFSFAQRLKNHQIALIDVMCTFCGTFASVLAKREIDSLHIMRLGRWESIQMVERCTRSVRFEDSLKLYRPIMG